MADIMDGMSMNLEQANMDKLKAAFPECFAEGKLDIDKLLSLCGEYIDNDFEKYKFEWKGKAESLRLAQKRSTGTLRPCPEDSVNWDTTQNLYIEGDNLEVLKLLQTAYFRKVKMIYIDPPYNTGNDFVYEDDFADPMARYKEVTQQTTKSNPETMGRFHTNWLNMMYPRLRIASNLLRDDGVIFISIDDNEVTNLRKVCDEVFGEENFVGQIVWQSTQKNDPRFIAVNHEYVLCYTKNMEVQNLGGKWRTKHPLVDEMMSEYEKIKQKNSSLEDIQTAWTSIINKEKYSALKHYKFVDFKGPYFAADISDPQRKGPKHDFVIHPVTKQVCKAPAGGYSPREEEMRRRLANDEIHFGATHEQVVCSKKYLLTAEDRLNSVYYEDGRRATKLLENLIGKGIFEHPKSEVMLKRLLGFVTEPDSIILDFFSGSATTAHAVMQLNAEDGGNRKFIMVQLPEETDEKSEAHKAGYKNICEIGKERIRRAGKSLTETDVQLTLDDVDKSPLDIGFRVLKLDSSNLKTWDATPVEEEQMSLFVERMNNMVHRVKTDRTDMDMVFEVMLKLGVQPTTVVEKKDVNGKTVYTVGNDSLLLICLAENVKPEDVEAMAEFAPGKIVISRDSFADDTAMANAHYILRDRKIELKLV